VEGEEPRTGKIDRPNVNATATRQARWARETKVRSRAAALLAEVLERQPAALGDLNLTGTPAGRNWHMDIVVDRYLLLRLYEAVEQARPGLVKRALEARKGTTHGNTGSDF